MPASIETALLEKIEELSFLRLLNDRLAGAEDFAAACRVLVETSCEERGGRHAAYFSADLPRDRVQLEAWAPDEAVPPGVPREAPLAAPPFSALLSAEGPQALVEGWLDGRAAPWLGTVLRVRAVPTGFLFVETDDTPAHREEDARLLAIVATSAAFALDAARNGAREEFVAMLRHDIANPLTAAAGYVEMLRERLEGRADDRALVVMTDTITELLKAIADLVSNYLHMAAIDRGAPFLRLEPVDLGPFVDQVLRPLRMAADDKGLTLATNVHPETIQADRRQLARVLTNLVSNAIKYTPAPGRIDVTVARDGGWVKLAVVDSGYGIDLTDQPRVFSKYARFHQQTGIPGTGLGLYLSRGIAEAHGGTIELKSTPGRGSTFCVRLPVAAS